MFVFLFLSKKCFSTMSEGDCYCLFVYCFLICHLARCQNRPPEIVKVLSHVCWHSFSLLAHFRFQISFLFVTSLFMPLLLYIYTYCFSRVIALYILRNQFIDVICNCFILSMLYLHVWIGLWNNVTYVFGY